MPASYNKGNGNPWRRKRSDSRKRFKPILHEIKWPLVAVIWVISIILGYIGFSTYLSAGGEKFTRLDLLYRSLQLIALEFRIINSPVPWQLQVARFLIPALAAYAAIQALLAIFNKQWQLFRIRFYKNHVVICGLGEIGFRLAGEFTDFGYRVLIIDENKDNQLIEQCQKQGAVVITGDATSRSALRNAGIQRAKYLLAVCSQDGTNAEIALQARAIVKNRRGRILTAFIHVIDLELCNLLKAWELTNEAGSFRQEFFNVFERGARMMLRVYPSYQKQIEAVEGRPGMVIVGLGKMGRSLIVQLAHDWWSCNQKNKKKLQVTVIDKAAESKIELLQLKYPQLRKACDFNVLQLGENSPDLERGNFLYNPEGRCIVDVIYICFDDDVHVMVNALTLTRITRKHNIPIIARMSKDAGLSTLIKEEGLGFENIHTFELLDMTCNLKALLGGTHEVIAKAIHEDYVNSQKQLGETAHSNPSMVSWEDLPETLKESNRHQAAHIEMKMKAIGCGIQTLNDWEAASFKFEPREIEQLAELEHRRWMEERRQNGWQYKAGKKDIKKMTSPYIVPYEQLSWEIKESDRNMIRNLPGFLARAGFQIYRRN
jgi:hypothetical protein